MGGPRGLRIFLGALGKGFPPLVSSGRGAGLVGGVPFRALPRHAKGHRFWEQSPLLDFESEHWEL